MVRHTLRTGLTLILGTIVTWCLSQNHVPNPSFELYDCIPTGLNESECIVEWLNPTDRTPDYCHENSNPNQQNPVNVPSNNWGYQDAFEGNAYLALHMFERDRGKLEYMQIELIQPLREGTEYKVSMYVSRADYSEVATNGIGALFTDSAFTAQGAIDMTPQFYYPDVIRNDSTWIQIEGTFIAESAYAYMTIGNFISNTDDYIIDTINQYITPNTGTYYIDVVSVEPTGRAIDVSLQYLNDCYPVKVIFDAVNIDQGQNWSWAFSDGDIQDGESVIRSFFNDIELTVALTTEENGISYTVERNFDIVGAHPATADFVVPDVVFVGDSIQMINQSMDANTFHWDFGDGSDSDSAAPRIAFESPGIYTITLESSTNGSCSDVISKEILVRCKNQISANAFTPNGDGKNDTFPFSDLVGCGDEIDIRIFSTTGNLVYQSIEPLDDWDARNIPEGTYYYVVQYAGGGEKGFIQVVR